MITLANIPRIKAQTGLTVKVGLQSGFQLKPKSNPLVSEPSTKSIKSSPEQPKPVPVVKPVTPSDISKSADAPLFDWLNTWYKDPVTQNTIRNYIDKGALKNYDGTALVPQLRKKFASDPNKIAQRNVNINTALGRINSANIGHINSVNYFNLSVLDRKGFNTDLQYEVLDKNDAGGIYLAPGTSESRGYKRYKSLNNSVITEDHESTIHELIHASGLDTIFKPVISSYLNPYDLQGIANQLIRVDGYEKDDDLIGEIYPRIMTWRYESGFKPGRKYTSTDVNSLRRRFPVFQYVPDDRLIKLLNNLAQETSSKQTDQVQMAHKGLRIKAQTGLNVKQGIKPGFQLNTKPLSTTQTTTQQPKEDPNDIWIKQILNYEKEHGAANGTGLQNLGYNRRTFDPVPIDQGVAWFKEDILPLVQNYPMELRPGLADFWYNAGLDPRIYILDQYYKSTGRPGGLPGRSEVYKAAMSEGKWINPAVQKQFNSLWAADSMNIVRTGKLAEFIDTGRDFFYQNVEKVNGKPNPAYDATWKGRIENTKKIKFAGGGVIKAQNGINIFGATSVNSMTKTIEPIPGSDIPKSLAAQYIMEQENPIVADKTQVQKPPIPELSAEFKATIEMPTLSQKMEDTYGREGTELLKNDTWRTARKTNAYRNINIYPTRTKLEGSYDDFKREWDQEGYGKYFEENPPFVIKSEKYDNRRTNVVMDRQLLTQIMDAADKYGIDRYLAVTVPLRESEFSSYDTQGLFYNHELDEIYRDSGARDLWDKELSVIDPFWNKATENDWKISPVDAVQFEEVYKGAVEKAKAKVAEKMAVYGYQTPARFPFDNEMNTINRFLDTPLGINRYNSKHREQFKISYKEALQQDLEIIMDTPELVQFINSYGGGYKPGKGKL